MLKASLNPPLDSLAICLNVSSDSHLTSSAIKTLDIAATISSSVSSLKLNTWHLDDIVAGTL